MSRYLDFDLALDELTESLLSGVDNPYQLVTVMGSATEPEFLTRPVFFANCGVKNVKARIQELTARMLRTYEEKDTDYSENDLPMGNFRQSVEMGISPWRGILLRIGDKKRRIGSFVKKSRYEVKTEKVDDTLMDLANYALLGMLLCREEHETILTAFDFVYDMTPETIDKHWKYMALNAMVCRLLYEYGDIMGEGSWKGDYWYSVNYHYVRLAAYSAVAYPIAHK